MVLTYRASRNMSSTTPPTRTTIKTKQQLCHKQHLPISKLQEEQQSRTNCDRFFKKDLWKDVVEIAYQMPRYEKGMYLFL